MKKINLFIVFLISSSLFACGNNSLQNSVNLKSTYDFLNTCQLDMNIDKFLKENQFNLRTFESKSLKTIQDELQNVSNKTYFNTFSELNLIKDFDHWIDYSESLSKPYINLKQLINQRNKFKFVNYQHGLNNIYMPEILDYLNITDKKVVGNNYEKTRIEKDKKKSYSNYYEINPKEMYCITEEKIESLLTNTMQNKQTLYIFLNKNNYLFTMKLTYINDNYKIEHLIYGNNDDGYMEFEMFSDTSSENYFNYYNNGRIFFKTNLDENNQDYYTDFAIFKNYTEISYLDPIYSSEKIYSSNLLNLQDYIEIKNIEKSKRYKKITINHLNIERQDEQFYYKKVSPTNSVELIETTWEEERPMIKIVNDNNEITDVYQKFLNSVQTLGLELVIEETIFQDLFLISSKSNEEDKYLNKILKEVYTINKNYNNIYELYEEIINNYKNQKDTNDAFISAIHNTKNYKYHTDYSDYSKEMINLITPKIFLNDNKNIEFLFDLKDLRTIDDKNYRNYYFKLELYSIMNDKDLNFYDSKVFSYDQNEYSFELSWETLKNITQNNELDKGNYFLKVKLVEENLGYLFSQSVILNKFVKFNDNNAYSFIESRSNNLIQYTFNYNQNNHFNNLFYLDIN